MIEAQANTFSFPDPGFARIPMDIYMRYTLSGTAREAYGLMLSRRQLSQGNPDWPWPGFICFAQRDLARILSVSEVSVRRALTELEDAGLIRRRRRGNGFVDLIRVFDPGVHIV
jgi:DNA-binding MarR family transcriptional regulator